MLAGLPRELMTREPMAENWARMAACLWLDWADSADFAKFQPVHLDD